MKMFQLTKDGELQKCPGCGYQVTMLYSMAGTLEQAEKHRDEEDIALCGDCMCEVLAENEHEITGSQVD